MVKLKDVRLVEGRTLRIIVPGGMVEITTGQVTAEGDPLVSVDVVPDRHPYIPDANGRIWHVVKSRVEGIVRMVGFSAEGKAL